MSILSGKIQVSLLNWNFKKDQKRYIHPQRIYNISDNKKIIFVILGFQGIWTLVVKSENLDTPNQLRLEAYPLFKNKEIRNIVESKKQTYVLAENGKVYEFLSYKKFEEISYLDNVKFLGKSESKSVVLRTINTDIVIEIYSSNFPEDQTILQKFELIGQKDEITSECSEAGDHFFIQLIVLDDVNKKLFKAFLLNELEELHEILLLSIDNKLMWMINEEEQEVVGNFLSKIIEFHLFQTRNKSFLLVLEENFTINLIQSCEITKTINSKKIYLSEVICFEFIRSKNLIVYASKTEIVQILFKYCENSQDVIFETHYHKFPGIAVLTFLSNFDTLIAINENKMFYKIALVTSEVANTNSEDEFFEVQTKNIKNVDQITNLMFEEHNSNLLIQQKFDKTLKIYRNMKNFSNIFKDSSFVTKQSNSILQFHSILNQNLVLIEVNLRNVNNSEKIFENVKILIDRYNPETGFFVKKILKLKNSLNRLDQDYLKNFQESPLNFKVKILFNLGAQCIKVVEIQNKTAIN